MRRFLALITILVPLVVAACGGPVGPQYAQVAQTIPPVPPDKARIYFYRDYEPYESLSRPYIYLNGVIAGISIPGGVFYRDVAPWRYLVSVDSVGIYWNQFKTVDLHAGDSTYIKIGSRRDWESGLDYEADTFVVMVVDATNGQREIADLTYVTGQ